MKTKKLPQSLFRVLLPLLIVTSVFLSGCACLPPLPVYDFEDGTIQGWRLTAVSDDQQKTYTPFWDLDHSGKNQNKKTGYLVIDGAQFGPWASQAGFPSGSQFWEVTAYNPCINSKNSVVWQGIKGVEVDLLDNFSMGTQPLKANIGVRVDVGGKYSEIMETDSQGKPLYHNINHAGSTSTWTHLKANLNIPSNAIVHQVWIKFRGSLNPGLWEGGFYIDNVKPVK